jgi:polyhydroxybutyrate depolymerase
MRLILAALLIVATALPAAAQQVMRHDGETRRYFLEPPRGARPAPVIVVLHGGVTVPSRMRRVTHFTLHEKGWAVVYPVALQDRWDAGDDLGFVTALIDRFAADGLIDPARVYITGAGDGGAMALRLLCDAPRRIAGAAIVSMTMPEGLDCRDGPAMPLLLVNGTADPVVPFEGGRAQGVGPVLSAADSAARLARRNGCGAYEAIPITDHYPADGTRVRLHSYRGCEAPMLHYIVEGGGHTWPGNRVSRWVERRLGTTSRDISATFEIEAFFSRLEGR